MFRQSDYSNPMEVCGILFQVWYYMKGILSCWDVIDRLIINLCSLDFFFFGNVVHQQVLTK
jgi:hypothetical protein